MEDVRMLNSDLADTVAAYFAGRGDLIADPYPLYSRLRAAGPVFRHEHMYLVVRHSDVAWMLRDERLQHFDAHRVPSAVARVANQSDKSLVEEWGNFFMTFLVGTDEPDHMRRRKLQQQGFLPKQVAGVGEYAKQTADSLLDRGVAKGEFDFFADIAHVLPSQVIAHMLGVPSEDMDLVRHWVDAVGYVQGLGYEHIPEVIDDLENYRAYVDRHIEVRRGRPQRDDLLGALMAAQEDGDKLTMSEVVVSFFNLLFSGSESTATGIVSGMCALLTHRDQWEKLCEDPEIATQATEEILRYISPIQYITRYTRDDIDVSGTIIPGNSTIKLMLGSANHDPDRFEAPDLFDVERSDTKSLVFGSGSHFCMGNALARLEIATTIRRCAQRFPSLQLASNDLNWRENPLMHRPSALPVVVPRVAAHA
jgi:pimeloyl-[acyl-carrier protein] synthase